MKNTMSWKTRLCVLGAAAVLAASFAACDADGDDVEDVQDIYSSETAKVDYNGTGPNSKKAVFFKFSTGKTSEVPLDFFDIAFSVSMGSAKIFANSGSYGSGVLVYKTDTTDIIANLSSQQGSVKEYTFRAETPLYGYQSAANPFDGEITGAGIGSGKVYLIKTGAGNFYKVIFDVIGMLPGDPSPTPGYKITVVKGLSGGTPEQTVITDSLLGVSSGFGYIYFDLDATGGPKALNGPAALKDGVTLDLPKAADWDILCARTDELQPNEAGTAVNPEMPKASRSSILLNIYKSVKAYKAEGKTMEQVVTIPEETEFSGTIDAIGYSWYRMEGMPPTFPLNTNTYIVKIADSKYAKFQPGSFYGPNTESFYMKFRYYYLESDSGTFDK